MLRIFNGNGSRTCDGLSRRDFMQVGALGLGGLTLADLFAVKAHAATADYIKDKAVVVLFLSGGPSHIETFDPKMTAPVEIRSTTGELQTSVPGVTFGGTFPLLARQAHKMAVVRSFTHPIGSHEQAIVHVLTGGTDRNGRGDEGFSVGALCTRIRGSNHPVTGMPSYAVLTETEVDPQYRNEVGRVMNGSRPGTLGSSFAAFTPSARTGPAVQNMTLALPADRFQNRMALLRDLGRLNRQFDAASSAGVVNRYQEQAMNLLLGGSTARALDLSREDPRLLASYNTSMMSIGHKQFRPSTLGQQLLTARRLCEAGCGFVTIHSAGWDMHADGNNPGIVAGMNMLGPTVDRAVSAFLEDIEQRGLGDKILFVLTGDFGRTPRVNNRGGRDHWARLCTLAFAGGGLRVGQVIGQSARNADVPASDPITPAKMTGTILHALFNIGQMRVQTDVPRDLAALAESFPPIADLV